MTPAGAAVPGPRTPLGVGTSTTKRAEEYGEEGEEGRHTLGTKDPSQRPYGTSDPEATGVGDQGG